MFVENAGVTISEFEMYFIVPSTESWATSRLTKSLRDSRECTTTHEYDRLIMIETSQVQNDQPGIDAEDIQVDTQTGKWKPSQNIRDGHGLQQRIVSAAQRTRRRRTQLSSASSLARRTGCIGSDILRRL